MTPAEAQAEIRSLAFDLVRLEERCQEVLVSLPRSPEERAIFEERIPWDLPTELRTTVESLLEVEIPSKLAHPSEGASHPLLSTSTDPRRPSDPDGSHVLHHH